MRTRAPGQHQRHAPRVRGALILLATAVLILAGVCLKMNPTGKGEDNSALTTRAEQEWRDKDAPLPEQLPVVAERNPVEKPAVEEIAVGPITTRESPALPPAKDFPAAVKALQSITHPVAREQFIRELALRWAATDAAAASAWAATLMESSERSVALVSICLREAQRDPRMAIEYAMNNDLVAEAGLVSGLAAQWATRDPVAAREWLDRFERGELRDQCYQRYFGALAGTDVSRALTELSASQFDSPQSRDEAVMTILHSYGKQAPEQATEWILQLPDEHLRPRALAETWRIWAELETADAEAWLAALPSGELKNATLALLSERQPSDRSPQP